MKKHRKHKADIRSLIMEERMRTRKKQNQRYMKKLLKETKDEIQPQSQAD